MARTANRPVPRGAILPGEALGFGLALAVGSVLVLGLLVNIVAAALLAFTIFFYAVIYTMWLKRSTPQNIVIGGAAGAFPPMIGWAAVTGSVDSRLDRAVPHHLHVDAAAFLGAGAVPRRRLCRAPACRCCRSSPGADETRRQILLYSLVLVPVTFLPSLLGTAGMLYTHRDGASSAWPSSGTPSTSTACARASRRAAPASACSAFRSFICSRIFALIIVERIAGHGALRSGHRMSARHEPEAILARGHERAAASAPSPGAGARRPRRAVLRHHHRAARRRRGADGASDMQRAAPSLPIPRSNRKVALLSAAVVAWRWSASPMHRCRSIGCSAR